MKKDEELWQVEFEQHKQVAAGAPTKGTVVKSYSCSWERLAKWAFTRP